MRFHALLLMFCVSCSSSSMSTPDSGATRNDSGPNDAGPNDPGIDAGSIDAYVAPGTDAYVAPDASMTNANGTLVPLYTYPGDETWTEIMRVARAHPTVTFYAIINPDSGPLDTAEPEYVTGIPLLQAAGIHVIGYVPTDYTRRDVTEVEGDIALYDQQYPTLEGIFFDEAAVYEEGHEDYYQRVVAYTRSHGLPFTVANPGTTPMDAYLPIFDVTLVYESSGLPDASDLSHYGAHPEQAGIIPYAVESLDTAFVDAVKPNVKWIFITDDDLPNPWDSLPPYFEALIEALE